MQWFEYQSLKKWKRELNMFDVSQSVRVSKDAEIYADFRTVWKNCIKFYLKNVVKKKVKENFSLSIFWQMIIKIAGFIPLWKRFFTLSPDLKAAYNSAYFDTLPDIFPKHSFYVLLAYFCNFEAKCCLKGSKNQSWLFVNVS